MTREPYNLVVYLGSGQVGRDRRERLEREARAHGYINKHGKTRLAPYIVDRLEGNIKPPKVAGRKTVAALNDR